MISLLLLWTSAWAEQPLSFDLKSSELTYTVSHLLKTVHGKSTEAKGKGRCSNLQSCEFLIAVPVTSFVSGNSNRDLHMRETVKGALHPIVSVRVTGALQEKLPLEVELSGHKKMIAPQSLKIQKTTHEMQVSGTFVLKLSDFEIERPSLLAASIENEVPISFKTTWTVH